MLFVGFVCTVVASYIVYRNFQQKLPLLFLNILWKTKYIILAVTDVRHDRKNANNNKNDCLPQPGRIAIVTGGSRGIGVEVVKMFLELDMEVIIGCRTPSAGEKAIREIRESGVNIGQAKVYKLDNASLKSVKEFAAEIKRDYKQIHILVNNAGIIAHSYQETIDGFEHHWAVNYLSHFLLTALLLPLLKAGGHPEKSSRIVNVSSCAHLLGTINFTDINNKNKYLNDIAYAQSKFAQVVSTNMLQDLLKEKKYYVQVYSVHPGVVVTGLFDHYYIWRYKSLWQYLFKTPRQGATSVVYAAVNEAVENRGGTYIKNCRPALVNPDALNFSIQKKLLELSLQQVQLNDFFQYVQ
ncbi:retinol dehydrogenase 11 [Xylocopa sonorina]|uniref:retinol dehydrogenase 11 n=1 Tax=Xylocopa sonorina TaxID=1818115 RepID=UPI00403AF083